MGVDPRRFVAPTFGKVIRTPGPHGYHAFLPSRLPGSLDLTPTTVLLLSEADRSLGRLAGAGRLLPNPHLLIGPSLTREALASSRIEGTQASLSDVFDARARNTAEGPVREVTNYIDALTYGLDRLASLPVSKRLLCEVHAILMADVRGHERNPGVIRSSQNWIGSPNNRPDTAVFVPPPVDEMKLAFDQLERYLNSGPQVPPLVEIALAHYQFETIHPYLDGNGRLGRLLVALLVAERGLLPQPLLYLSAYFERHRSDYYDHLQAVRERGELSRWLDFFLSAVAEQAVDALSRAETLADLREAYRSKLSGDRSRAAEVVDLVFENPVLVTGRVVREFGTGSQNARNQIRRLEREGMIREVASVPGRSKRWVAHEVLALLDPDAVIDLDRN